MGRVTVAELEVIVTAKLDQLEAKMNDAKGQAKTAGKQIGEALASGIGMAVGSFSFQAVIEGAKELVRGMVSGNSEMERYTTQFAVLLGSVDAAGKRMKELAHFAAVTPFQLPEVVQASKQLQVMGGTALATGKVLTMVGDMASAAGAQYGEVAMWVGRLYSSLKGGRPFGEAAQRLQELGLINGETRNKMEAMTKAGAKAADVWQVFTNASKQFDGMMDKQSQTLEGLTSTLKDDFAATLREVGKPLFDKVKESVKDLIAVFENPAMRGAAKTIAAVVAAVAGLAGMASGVAAAALAWSKLAAGFELVSTAVGGLEGVLAVLTGPVGWVIAAAGLIYVAWKNNLGGFRDWTMKIVGEVVNWWKANLPLIKASAQDVAEFVVSTWASIKEPIMAIWDTIAGIVRGAWGLIRGIVQGALTAIGGLLRAAMQVIHGDWSGAWETIKKTAMSVWSRLTAAILNGVAGILEAIKGLGNMFARVFGYEVTGLDNSIKYIRELANGFDKTADSAGSAANKTGQAIAEVKAQTKAVKDLTQATQAHAKAQMDAATAGLGDVRMGGGTGTGTKGKNGERSDFWRELKAWAEAQGFTVTSTTGGVHNKGSLHKLGLAVDVSVRGKSADQIKDFMQKAAEAGIKVLDERVRPKGQQVWDGAHLHLQGKPGMEGSLKAQTKEMTTAEKLTDTLTKRVKELAAAFKMGGDTSDEATLKYQLQNNVLKGHDADMARQILQYTAAIKVKQDDAEKTKAIVAAIMDQHKALMLLHAEQLKDPAARMSDKLAVENYGKHYADLRADHKKLIDDLTKETLKAAGETDAKQKIDESRQAVKGLVTQLQQEIDLYDKKTRVQQVAYELQKEQYKTLAPLAKAMILAQASVLDQKAAAAADAGKKKGSGTLWGLDAEGWKEIFDRIKRAKEEAFADFTQSMAELNNRMIDTQGNAEKLARDLGDLTQRFGGGEQGRKRAEEYMQKLLDVQRAEAFRDKLRGVTEELGDRLTGVLDDLWQNGFSNLFGNIIQGFRMVAADMVREWALAQVKMSIAKGATSLVSGIIGALGGGSHGGGQANANPGGAGVGQQFAAAGGPRLAHQPLIVGENGPEMFIPAQDGRIVTNHQLRKGGAGGGVTNVFNISTNDAGSFMRSKTQIEAAMMAAAMRSARRTA